VTQLSAWFSAITDVKWQGRASRPDEAGSGRQTGCDTVRNYATRSTVPSTPVTPGTRAGSRRGCPANGSCFMQLRDTSAHVAGRGGVGFSDR